MSIVETYSSLRSVKYENLEKIRSKKEGKLKKVRAPLPGVIEGAPINGSVEVLTPFTLVMRILAQDCGITNADGKTITFFLRDESPSQTSKKYVFNSTSERSNVAYFQFIKNSQGGFDTQTFDYFTSTWVECSLPISNFLGKYYLQPNLLNSSDAYKSFVFTSFNENPTLQGNDASGYFTSLVGESFLPNDKVVGKLLFYPLPGDVYTHLSLLTTPGVDTYAGWILSPSSYVVEGWVTSQPNGFSDLSSSVYGWFSVGEKCLGGCPAGEGCFYSDSIGFNQSVTTPYQCLNVSTYHKGLATGKRGMTGVSGNLPLIGNKINVGEKGVKGEKGNTSFGYGRMSFFLIVAISFLIVVTTIYVFYFHEYRKRVVEKYLKFLDDIALKSS